MNITMPHVLVRCGGGDDISGANPKLEQELCLSAVLDGALAPKTLQWPIPSGYPAHSAWVARLTTFSALGGVAAIFVASKFAGVK